MSDHKPGCEALGGYGHGVGPCTCGADTTSAAPSERELFEALQEFADDPSLLQRQLDGKSYIYTRIQGMWEGWQAARRAPQPVTLEPLTDEQVEAAAKMLAQCMDYPWGCMPDKGRAAMREHARKVVAAACHHVEKGGA